MLKLTSRENPQIKRLSALLSSRREREESGLFVAEGLRICTDAAASGIGIEAAYFTPAIQARFPRQCRQIQAAAKQSYELGEHLKIGDTKTPQGIFCLCRQPLPGLPDQWPGRYVLLSSLQDPGNVGTIIRTADALGLDGVILSDDCPDLYSPKVIRATMGGIFTQPVYAAKNMANLIAELRQAGVTVIAAALDDHARPPAQTDFSAPCAVVLGNEGSGLTDEITALCDKTVMIPMARPGQSLNAAIAATILMWELTDTSRGAV